MSIKINLLPSVEYLEERFLLVRDAGALIWKTRPREHFESDRIWNSWNSRYAGLPAGTLRPLGYVYTSIARRAYPNHRIIWKMAYGLDPAEEIDHINGIRSDNRLCNLREASKSQNQHNACLRRDNFLQVKGVTLAPDGSFCAQVDSNRVHIVVGHYITLEEAKAARDKAAFELHGEFFRP